VCPVQRYIIVVDVVLFGSPLNPLSGVAAAYLHSHGHLRGIVIPARQGIYRNNGLPCFLSQCCIGLYRYLHVFLRRLELKRSERYACLREFLVTIPDIPMIRFHEESIAADVERLFGDIKHEDRMVLACVFSHKIPANIKAAKLVNIHPGMLPENRGPNPYFWALAGDHEKSGVAFHVLLEKMDGGDLLFQEVFDILPNQSEYHLEQRSARILKEMLPRFFCDLETYWLNAQQQPKGQSFKEPTARDRRQYSRRTLI